MAHVPGVYGHPARGVARPAPGAVVALNCAAHRALPEAGAKRGGCLFPARVAPPAWAAAGLRGVGRVNPRESHSLSSAFKGVRLSEAGDTAQARCRSGRGLLEHVT